jgi:branched-chain amino acid transport system permease protein
MLSVILSGIALGAIYSSVAMVYNLTYATSRVLSITAGFTFMIGGVLGAYFIDIAKLQPIVGFLATLAAGALLGLAIEFIAVRRVLGRSDQHLWLLSTLAFSTIIQQVVALTWGTEPRRFPRLFKQDFGGLLDQKYWLPIGAVLLVAAMLELFLRRTIIGKLFVAVSDDTQAAIARGIPVNAVRAASYALAGMVGSLTGFAAGQLTFAYFALGFMLTLNGFIALAIGGLGSTAGALTGGLLLGLLTAFATHFFGGAFQNSISTGLLIILLLARPQGLFGVRAARMV